MYEGRGWETVGAHVYGYNSRSVGIAFIGKYNTHLPDRRDIQAVHDLITTGRTLVSMCVCGGGGGFSPGKGGGLLVRGGGLSW